MNRAMHSRAMSRQHGVALFVALVFLVILTLISITAMRSSTMGLHMASNEQEQRIGLDSTQSASDMAMKKVNIKVTVSGATTCIGFGYTRSTTLDDNNCTNTEELPAVAGAGTDNFTQLTQLYDGTCPAFVATGVRASGGGGGLSCTYYTITNVYDATAKRGGRSTTVEGMVMETMGSY